MNILITICARGGSKGIPGKNIKMLNGQPLISYSIKISKLFCNIHDSDIALSTDSDEIINVADNYGLTTAYQRPKQLSGDNAGKILVIKDLLLFEESSTSKRYDYIVDLDVTSPLRTVEDIENAFNLLVSKQDAYNIFSVSLANRNPYYNMVEIGEEGFANIVKEGAIFKSRQEAPVVYDMNASFYIYRRNFFSEGFESAITNRSLVYVVPHICFDLDHPNDFVMMEVMIKEGLLDFKL
jgi:CMP-N,N'-diacetyllegionaminic acid synthase